MQSTVTTKDKKTNIVEEIALIVKLVCPKEKKKEKFHLLSFRNTCDTVEM